MGRQFLRRLFTAIAGFGVIGCTVLFFTNDGGFFYGIFLILVAGAWWALIWYCHRIIAGWLPPER